MKRAKIIAGIVIAVLGIVVSVTFIDFNTTIDRFYLSLFIMPMIVSISALSINRQKKRIRLYTI